MIFKNEPLLELRRQAVRREALQALDALDAKLPLEVPMLIGEDIVHGRRFASVDPSSPTRIVAYAHEATADHVKDAITRAMTTKWSKSPVTGSTTKFSIAPTSAVMSSCAIGSDTR